MKKIWFDISHPAQFNFYFNAIKALSYKYHIFVTVLARGKLPKIARKELAGLTNVNLIIKGKHRGTKTSAIIDANALRLLSLFFFLLKNKVDLHYSNGFQGSFLSKFFNFPAITFDDDPNRFDYKLKLFLSNKTYYCLFSDKHIQLDKKAKILKCLKEWSYLNPQYFTPDKKALDIYNVKPKEYIFIREVSTGTVNYAGQAAGLVTKIIDDIPKQTKVLLSLEDKSTKHLYPDSWVLLEEPIESIHSLIYYSKAVISSGDSMAREGAILGLPSFYVGVRSMPANHVLENLVDFVQVDTEEFAAKYLSLVENSNADNQLKNIEILKKEFIDINKLIIKITRKLLKE